ncbi:hypothetical protein OAP05_06675 [Schleiferiaceae bacterium]|jgi:hypothetical protein|nr:hypothetical protein [bacterium]MDC0615563.1 hypothetical protein [Schleiferiaceae bacterium]MDG1534534.1 hypothetical protein [Schleiferiaceae bacterium]MDG1919101.1 hypothetical protein [Schleiferiaceae bacterium]CAI8159360.1 MAG: Uncharacterised protein [Flavobacteriales bacterium UBA4585]
MNFPKFLVADNTDLPEAVYIVHTEFPSFILNLENDEVKWLDDIGDESEGDLTKILEGLIAEAEAFYTREVERYNL